MRKGAPAGPALRTAQRRFRRSFSRVAHGEPWALDIYSAQVCSDISSKCLAFFCTAETHLWRRLYISRKCPGTSTWRPTSSRCRAPGGALPRRPRARRRAADPSAWPDRARPWTGRRQADGDARVTGSGLVVPPSSAPLLWLTLGRVDPRPARPRPHRDDRRRRATRPGRRRRSRGPRPRQPRQPHLRAAAGRHPSLLGHHRALAIRDADPDRPRRHARSFARSKPCIAPKPACWRCPRE